MISTMMILLFCWKYVFTGVGLTESQGIMLVMAAIVEAAIEVIGSMLISVMREIK